MTKRTKGPGTTGGSGENRRRKKVKTPFYYRLKDELYYETFYKDEDEFSPERIEYLVKLLELEDPSNMQEIEEARLQFEENFKKISKKRRTKDRIIRFLNRLAGIAAVVIFTFMVADITTNAVMDESLFHMFSRWKNQVVVKPAKNEVVEELSSFSEAETQFFYSMESFEDYFGDNFLICSWLPENTKLNEIQVSNIDENQLILWEYKNSNIEDWKLQIWMHQGAANDVASIAGTLIEQKEFEVKNIVGNKVTYYSNNDSLLAGFDYGDWWYLVNILPYDENTLTSILKGMKPYEEME